MELGHALDLLLAEAVPVPAEWAPAREAAGRVAAEDVAARVPVPHFRRAAMDGYVCHDDDLRDASVERPVSLRVSGAVRMGAPPGAGPARGEAWSVTTGGPMPARGDRVLPIEAVRPQGAAIRIDHSPAGRRNIAEPGEDIRGGAPLVVAGAVITPEAAAALAASGVETIAVRRRLRVGVVATGTELEDAAPDAAALAPGRVINSNSIALCGALAGLGCDVTYRGVVRDDPDALRSALAGAVARDDVVVSTGGVSVGRYDAVHRTWLDLGARRIVGRVDLKPGGPFFAARLDDRWVLGLSGTPVACFAAYHLLGRPAVLRLAGRRFAVRPVRLVTLTTPLHRAADRQRALWGKVREPAEGPPEISILDGSSVGNYAAILDANALALLAPGTPPLPSGSRVPALLLDQPETANALAVPRSEPAPLVIGVVGESGSGKTTVLDGVLRRLNAWGITAAAVKHAAHGFSADRPGSDSGRLWDAGPMLVAVVGPEETMLRIAGEIAGPDRAVRLVIELCRSARGAPPDCVFLEGYDHPDRPVVQVGASKPGAVARDVWVSVPAVAGLDAGELAGELERVAGVVRARLGKAPRNA